ITPPPLSVQYTGSILNPGGGFVSHSRKTFRTTRWIPLPASCRTISDISTNSWRAEKQNDVFLEWATEIDRRSSSITPSTLAKASPKRFRLRVLDQLNRSIAT